LTVLAAQLLGLSIDTIGTRFPNMPVGFPSPSVPVFSLAKIREVLPSAFTIAFLAGIEALLSAVVADGMTGYRHRSNQELVGQGFANIASTFFGGLPATGAIARTATNVRAGGRTPVAGIMHAAFLLVFIPALSELSATILLYSGGTETISVALFRLNDLGQLEVVAALAVFTIAVTLLVSLPLNWLSSRSLIAPSATAR
jgi:SulP family sulfate permease